MLMHVTGKVDCFGYIYVCAHQTQSEYSLFYSIIYIMSCVLMFMYYSTVCYFTDNVISFIQSYGRFLCYSYYRQLQ